MDKLDFIDILFIVSITLLLAVGVIYILSLAYYIFKIARLKKEFYDESLRVIDDLRIEVSLFRDSRKKTDENNSKIVKDLRDISYTCNKIKNGIDEIKSRIERSDKKKE